MDDNIKFTPTPVRNQRSNAGADVLFYSSLVQLFGLDKDVARDLIQHLETSDKISKVRNTIKLMPITTFTTLQNVLDSIGSSIDDDIDTDVTPSNNELITNDNLSKYVNVRSTDDWDPSRDDELSFSARDGLPPVAKSNDYNFPNRVHESFIQYLVRETSNMHVDATIAAAGDQLDQTLDASIQQRIQALRKSGNNPAADALKARELKKLQLTNNKIQIQQPNQVQVDNTKRAYANALQQQQRMIRASTNNIPPSVPR